MNIENEVFGITTPILKHLVYASYSYPTLMAESIFDIKTHLKYFLTLKGIFRIINACYFFFYLLLASIFSGTLSIYTDLGTHQSALGFAAFVCFCVGVGQVVMSVIDILNLSFLQPYAFFILLGETICHGVAFGLLFITTIALTAYAATFLGRTMPIHQHVVGIDGSGAFFGYVALLLLGVTVGVYIYLLITRTGTKRTSDPV